MEQNLLNGDTSLSKPDSRGFWILIRTIVLVLVVAGLACSGGVFVWAQSYEGRLPPHSSIDGIAVGGLDPELVRQQLQQRIDTIVTHGIPVTSQGETKTLSLITRSASDLFEDADFALDETVDELMHVHKDHPVADAFAMFRSLFQSPSVTIPVTLNQEQIQANIRSSFPEHEIGYTPVAFSMERHGTLWSIGVVDGTAGSEFDWESFFETLTTRLTQLSTEPIELKLNTITPRTFTEDEKRTLASKAATAVQSAPHEIVYENQTWELLGDELAIMLAPADDLTLTLADEPLTAWIDAFVQDINQTPRDARLTIENGRVVDFVESIEGRTVDTEQLKQDLLTMVAITQEAPMGPITLVVDIVPPATSTSDVNDLGIDEVLGVGTSSYRGSPTNRRANIQNGVDLLNGILIAPGETFSLLKALSPFTYENGYLQELVIKGDKIEPEIGGGLCQIGTTTFRTTMNSGLSVLERRNHSLTVSYYNDPSNGNPGTDATIYDPAPDYKFLNDTEHYILFQAENLTETQELRFTFWGTNDGRKGTYTPPVVSRWIPVGETQYIETLDLEPGVEQCQGSHIGADASFTYTVVSSTGEIAETLFESHYRPLPTICLVGVEELTPPPSLSTEILAPESDAP